MVNGFLTTLLYHIREELFYFCNKNVPYLCGLWRFANAYLIWIIGGTIAGGKIAENRPMFNFSHISGDFGQIPELSADLEEATQWLTFDVNYEDNYYMNIEVDTSSPLCISLVSETGEIIHTLTEKTYKEKNIRLHLEKGSYSIYFSDFPGGSIYVKASMR